MNEIAKIFASLLLLGAGFAGASLFGPPNLVDNFAAEWSQSTQQDPQSLRPLDANTPLMPQPLVADASRATPIEIATRDPGLQPAVGQFTAEAAANQTLTTQWNDQPSQAGASNSDWLREIHRNNVGPTRSEQFPNQQPYQVAKANSALTSLPELQAPSRMQQPNQSESMKVDATSADAWGIPSFESPDEPFTNQPSTTQFQPPAIQDSFGSMVEQNPSFYPDQSAFRDIEAPAVQRAPKRSMGENERTHVVADGDTLPNLAERYLGDARLAQELYKYNQDRLQHPDLLPIGVILKLPNRPTSINSAPRLAPAQIRPNGSPFSTIGQATEPLQPQSSGIVHESKLVPIGEALERPAAAPPQLLYQEDYSW